MDIYIYMHLCNFSRRQHVCRSPSLSKYQEQMTNDKNQKANRGCTNILELQLHFGLEFSFSSPEYSLSYLLTF